MGFRMPQTQERTAELERALQAFLQAIPSTDVQLVVLFGSHATGRVRSKSDLDLIVVRPTAAPFLRRADDLAPLFPDGIPVDLLVYTPQEWESLSQTRPFHRRALAEGKVLYRGSPQ